MNKFSKAFSWWYLCSLTSVKQTQELYCDFDSCLFIWFKDLRMSTLLPALAVSIRGRHMKHRNCRHKQPLWQKLSIRHPSLTRCQSDATLMPSLPNLCHFRADPVSTPHSAYANPMPSTCQPHATSVAILRQQYANGGPLLGPVC